MAAGEREIRVTSQLLARTGTLDERTRAQAADAIGRPAGAGPALGRPLAGSLAHSSVRNLKEPRPGSAGRSEVRIIFASDPWRPAILLAGGGKPGGGRGWYRRAIPHAEQLYAEYLKEREAEEGR